MTDELIQVIAREKKIVHYLDIPIQHANDGILRAMRRRSTRSEIEALFAKLRAAMPDVAIRTSLICGLPGEGEAEFEELCAFLREQKLQRAGVFQFSPEEGRTYADSVDIDGRVLFTAAGLVPAGTFVNVRITGASDGDLTGEIEE